MRTAIITLTADDGLVSVHQRKELPYDAARVAFEKLVASPPKGTLNVTLWRSDGGTKSKDFEEQSTKTAKKP